MRKILLGVSARKNAHCVKHFSHTVYLYVSCMSDNALIVSWKSINNRLACEIEMECVYCLVETHFMLRR